MYIYSLYLIIFAIIYFVKLTSLAYIRGGGGQRKLVFEYTKCSQREK